MRDSRFLDYLILLLVIVAAFGAASVAGFGVRGDRVVISTRVLDSLIRETGRLDSLIRLDSALAHQLIDGDTTIKEIR